MAVSVGGILFQVGMNTNGYSAGAKRIEQIDLNLKNRIKRNHFETAQIAKQLNEVRIQLDEVRARRRKALDALEKKDTEKNRERVEALTKERDKLVATYESQFKSLKGVIERNKTNVAIMREEAEIAKQNVIEQSKLKSEYNDQAKAKRTLNGLARSGLKFAGLGAAVASFRKLKDAMWEAGEQALKLKREAENGVINPQAWTAQNIQLARYGEGVETTKNIFNDLKNSFLSFVSTGVEMVSTGKSYNQIQKENEETARRLSDLAIRKAHYKNKQLELEKEIKEINEINKDYERTRADYSWELLSDEEKISKLIEQQKNLREQLNSLDKDSVAFAKAKLDFLKAKIEREKLQKSIQEKARKEAEAESKRAQKDAEKARKEAEAESKKLADKQKQIALARQDFELQFKIAKLEKGNAQQQAQAEAIKNAIKRNELMEKYGYSIEQATRVLKAQKDLENQGKVKYSEKDIEKAQKIVKRSETNFVGKKTLEQAQAILNGQEIKGKRLSVFENVKPMKANPMQFANIPTPTVSPITQQSIATQSPIANAQATPTATQTQSPSNVLKQILDAINNLPAIFGTQLKEVFSE